MKLPRLLCVAFLLSLVLSLGQVAFAQEKKAAPIGPAEAVKDGWDEIDQRLIFLIIRLANTETSLEAVEKTIAASSRQKSAKIGDAKRALGENEKMDRKGGGPVHWSVFYGRTAEKFFYHPTDRNSTYHTVTVLSQQPPQNDTKSAVGVPSRQGLPVHQRPPQFDYIYKANQSVKERAEAEADLLKNKIDALLERRQKLEQEQNALWIDIAFRAVAHFDLDKKPLLRFEPVAAANDPDARLHADILKSAAIFERVALSVIDEAQKDQSAAFTRIKPVVSDARQTLTDNWLRLGVDSTDRKTAVGRFTALAKRLDDVASNLSESYEVAVDGDRQKDQLRKETFRGQLQGSLVDYAEIILALDEMAVEMRNTWQIKPDLDKPFATTIGLSIKPPAGRLNSYSGTNVGDIRDNNALKMVLCWCPPGTFMMGSPKTEVDRGKNEDQVLVTLSDGFWLGRFEVTQGEWQQIMGTTLAQQKSRANTQGAITGVGPRHPMEFVSHDEATAFCFLLTQQEQRAGRLPHDWEYRLPTEAQWEYACRAGTTTATAFGNSLDSTMANFIGDAPYGRASKRPLLGRTTEVGSYKPNDWSLCDMHGNVIEWCADMYAEKHTGGRDPVVSQVSGSSNRANRGGSWNNVGAFNRSAWRSNAEPGSRHAGVGFRVAVVQSHRAKIEAKEAK